jgi:hypothetical protein
MKKRVFMNTISIVILVFGLTVIGCPNPNNAPEDTWTKVASPSEMIGSWEGSMTIPVPAQEEFNLPASSISYTLAIIVTTETFTEVIDGDMNKYLTDFVGSAGKEAMWATIKDFLDTESDPRLQIDCTDDYHIKMTFSDAVSNLEFNGENAEYAPCINKDKTKMKIVLPEELNMYGEGGMEFILYKI